MAKKSSVSADGSTFAAGGEDFPKTKTAAAIRFVEENPDLVATHSHKQLAELISKKYNFESAPGDVANAKALVRKGRRHVGLKRRAAKKAGRSVAAATATSDLTPAISAPASASATDAVNATLNLVRAVGLEQAAAIISGLTKSK